VLEAMREHYERHNANVARSVHTLGTESTAAYEGARAEGAPRSSARRRRRDRVFTKNATEAINLVAYAFSCGVADRGRPRFRLGPGDEIVITEMEHHSNIVPWQLLCERTGATLRWFGITTRAGWTSPPGRTRQRADQAGLDGAGLQHPRYGERHRPHHRAGPRGRRAAHARRVAGVPHKPVDVSTTDADFLAFTGHKMLGPTGIGVLWGRRELLAAMPPFLGGGSMIEDRDDGGSTFAPPPARFEAGTPPIAEAVGLGAAVDYLTAVGMEAIAWYEKELTAYALTAGEVPDLRIFGPPRAGRRGGTISFELAGIHPHDVGQVLDAEGVQVRVGHHCARPTCVRFGVSAMTGMSLYLYNTTDEIDALVAAGQGTGGVRADAARTALPGHHPGPLQKPRGRGCASRTNAQVRHVNPDLRRRGRPAGALPTARSSTCRTRAWAVRSVRPRPACCTS
jgi:cysteine desulfurase/selenocysteine lyase